jgi:hypothetical protein
VIIRFTIQGALIERVLSCGCKEGKMRLLTLNRVSGTIEDMQRRRNDGVREGQAFDKTG